MRCYLLLGIFLLSTASAHGQLAKPPPGTMPGAAFSRALSQSSLYFVENQGQVDDRVHYYVRGRDRDVFVTEEGLTLLLRPPAQSQDMTSPVSFPGRTLSERHAGGAAFAVRLEFVNARPHPKPQAEGTHGPLVNLFTGGQGSWRTSIPTTSGLVYKDLWPGIDLALVGDTQRINYEFRVKPGADPDQIRMRYRGGAPPRLEPSGDLAIDTPLGTISDPRPFSYQESGGQRTEVGSRYALAASEDGSFGFALSGYDRTKLLVIDPAVFVYASYLGGAGEDRGSAVAVDASGAAYITGDTTSSESTFPTGTGFGFIPGVDRIHNGGYDAFVAKVHPSGTGLEYVTYVGGSGADQGQAIAVDGTGSVYVTGLTNSGTLFPTVGGPRTVYGGGAHDVFVFKLDPSGAVLLYSGFIGGADDDREPGIAIDTDGSAYITGLTYSSESTFPTGTGFGSLPGADQTHNGDADAFVVKVSPDGSSLQFASYIGGSAFDQGYSIGIDAARNVYVGGNVGSNENTFPDGDGVGPIPGPDTTYNGGGFDAFVVKLNPEGTSFAYVAFVGGAGGSERDERYATGLAVDPQGSAWIAGGRASAEDTFPTGQGFGSIPGFDRTSNGGRDAFVVKINSAGTAFDYATYIGGPGDDDAMSMTVDLAGNAYVTGWTSSNESTFPDGDGFDDIPGPDTSYNGGPHDIFVVKLNAEGTGLGYATYIGGPGDELGAGIALDASSNAYVVGYTTSTNSFPGGSGFGGLPGFDHVHNGGGVDAFVVKIGPPSPTPTAGAGPDQSIQVGATVTLQGSGSCPSGSPVPTWSFIGMPPGSAATLSDPNAWRPAFVADAAGYYTLGLQASCEGGTGFDYVTIRARDCGGKLTIYPVSVTLTPGTSYHFVANGGTGNYTWSIAEVRSGMPSIAAATDGGADYRAGDSSGDDTIIVSDTCTTKTATVHVESNEPPEVVDFSVLPNPTQGQSPIQVLALFSQEVDRAELCIDAESSLPEGSCREMDIAPAAPRLAGLNVTFQPADPAGVPLGRHAFATRGFTEAAGWGALRLNPAIDVTENVAILLLNGYSFDASPGTHDDFCGTHPEQWWRLPYRQDSQATWPIACQINDWFFDHQAPAPCAPPDPQNVRAPAGTDCSITSTQRPYVCVVDNLDGQEGLYDVPTDCVGRGKSAGNLDSSRDNNCIGNISRVETYIRNRPWLNSADAFILIGHSYGGQIARAYAREQLRLGAGGRRIKAVITLDTPHLGTGVRQFLGSAKEQITDMPILGHKECTTGDRALYWLGTFGADAFNHTAPEVPQVWALSTKRRVPYCKVFSLHWCQNIINNDSAVPLYSQQAQGLLGGLDLGGRLEPNEELSRGTVGDYNFNDPKGIVHNLILEDPARWPNTFARIKEALAKSNAKAAAQEAANAKQILVAEEIVLPQSEGQEIGTWKGIITTTAPVLTTIPVESGQDLVVDLWTSNANPAPTLEGPSGEVVHRANVDGLLNRFLATVGPDGLHQTFLVHQPSSGLWTLRFSVPDQGGGPHVPAIGASWQVRASIRSPLTMSLSTPEISSLAGDTLKVTATVETGNSGLTGAIVTAVITPTGGTPMTQSLYDDGEHADGLAGDGVYASRIVVGDWSGASLLVTATGNSPLGQFQRETSMDIAVYPVQATIHEPFAESAPDADSDGQYDSLSWSFPVQVAGAGSYSVVADLVAADGTPVSHATTLVTAATPGDMQVTLIFLGEDIYRGGRLGPYTLSSVAVYFAANDGQHLVARGANLAVSGGTYWSWLNFEREESPKLTWLFPVVQEVTPSNSVTLRWRVQDGNGATTFDLYYDTTGEGFDGTVIALDLNAVNGLMNYEWDISALPDGVYYVYARIRNGDYSNAVYGGSIARLIDTDGDGAPDSWEAPRGLNPNDSADAFEDSDGDGLANLDEYFSGTHPQMADTDTGGENDYSELVNGRDAATSEDDVVGISLLSVTPAVGDSRGGDTLFVIGSGFQNGAAVDFGGTMAAGVTFINSTRLLVVTPAHAVATVDFTVTNPGGGGSAMKPGGFTFLCEFVEPPVASNSGPFCPGQPLQLNASGLNGATYQWAGPNGFSSSLQNPTINPATAAAAGQYAVTMTAGSCQVEATTIAVSSAPAAPSVSSNGPLCSGQDLHLSATTVEGATYSWTGPNGFVSAQEDPVLPAANPAASGIYLVTATVSSCPSAPASTEVVVRALPTAVVSGSTQICSGESGTIQAALTGTAPWSLTWSDSVSQSGLVASPAIRTVQPTIDTTFEVTTVSDAYCAGTASGSAEITVGGQCGSELHTVTPCRIADTRDPAGPYGAPSLVGGQTRLFTIAGRCGIPETAKAVLLNITVTGATAPGFLTLYSADASLPLASSINFSAGKTRANNAITGLGAGGVLAVFSGQSSGGVVDVILDVSGYFE